MKSLYIASSHSFQEQPQLEQPIAKDSDLHAFIIDDFIHRVGEYEMHLQQLRLIPCRHGDKWEEGVLYEEGKDYEIKGADEWKWTKSLEGKIFVAASTPPTTEEAELWKQVAADISGATSYITIEVAKGDWKTAQDIVNKLYASLQQKYSLSRRSEQNSEAVELLNWMAKNHVICAESANGNASFVLNEKIATKYDLYQEFQLFKQKQSEPEPATPGQWYARLEGCKTPEDVEELEKKHADAINANPDLRRLFVIYKYRLKKNLS